MEENEYKDKFYGVLSNTINHQYDPYASERKKAKNAKRLEYAIPLLPTLAPLAPPKEAVQWAFAIADEILEELNK